MPRANPTIATAKAALARLRADADPLRAEGFQRFFKTGPGEYAEGDRFLGLTVPMTRAIAKDCDLSLTEIERLLASEWHEARLLALILYVRAYGKTVKGESAKDVAARRNALHESYLANLARVNNWDLVDTSAEYLVGAHLRGKSHALLTKLARSESLWERRVAMIATFAFIKDGESDDALRIATMLLRDEHDLMHKAVGWMLREVGKRCDADTLRAYLDAHAARMPRTALRYAIEHFDAAERARYLAIPRAR